MKASNFMENLQKIMVRVCVPIIIVAVVIFLKTRDYSWVSSVKDFIWEYWWIVPLVLLVVSAGIYIIKRIKRSPKTSIETKYTLPREKTTTLSKVTVTMLVLITLVIVVPIGLQLIHGTWNLFWPQRVAIQSTTTGEPVQQHIVARQDFWPMYSSQSYPWTRTNERFYPQQRSTTITLRFINKLNPSIHWDEMITRFSDNTVVREKKDNTDDGSLGEYTVTLFGHQYAEVLISDHPLFSEAL